MSIPLTPTDVLREELAKARIASPESYEWDDAGGEALYRGDPIQGRATEQESSGIEAARLRIGLEFEPCIDCGTPVNIQIGQCGKCAAKDGYE